MKMNKRNLLPVLLMLLTFTACETKEDLQAQVDALIEQRVEERRTAFKKTLLSNCDERILQEATRIVDSILIAEARLKKDTIDRPDRPDRPQLPEVKKLKDTLPVAPLFPEGLPLEPDSLRGGEQN